MTYFFKHVLKNSKVINEKDTYYFKINLFKDSKYFIKGLTSKFAAMPRINSSERVHSNRSVKFDQIVMKDAFLLTEFIFLDDEERIKFSQGKHEHNKTLIG